MLGQCPACAPPEAAATTSNDTGNDYDDGEGGKGPFAAGHLQCTPVTCAGCAPTPTQPNPPGPEGGDPDPVEGDGRTKFTHETERERERTTRDTYDEYRLYE